MGARVLVADDEQSTADLAKLYLSREGYHVETAKDGQEALDKAHQVHPDLVILDIMMPILDGWEVCRRLRQEGDTPIIVLTARTSYLDKITGLELGADDYVTKPFNPRELVARVAAVLRRSRTAQLPTRVEGTDAQADPYQRGMSVHSMPITGSDSLAG